MKIHCVRCGTIYVDQSVPFYEKSLNPFAYAGIFRSSKKQIELPVFAYIIEHPKALLVIDTGWHTNVRTHSKKYLGWLQYTINKPSLPEGEAIHEHLQQLGYTAGDVDYVVLTHLHGDHVSGLDLIKEAKKILVSDIELQATLKDKIGYSQHMWKNIPIETFTFTASALGPFHQSLDLLNDGSIEIIATPGHTQGLSSVLLSGKKDKVLLCSDVGYTKKAWEELLLPGYVVDKYKAITSLQWLQSMSKHENITILASHDPAISPQVIQLS